MSNADKPYWAKNAFGDQLTVSEHGQLAIENRRRRNSIEALDELRRISDRELHELVQIDELEGEESSNA